MHKLIYNRNNKNTITNVLYTTKQNILSKLQLFPNLMILKQSFITIKKISLTFFCTRINAFWRLIKWHYCLFLSSFYGLNFKLSLSVNITNETNLFFKLNMRSQLFFPFYYLVSFILITGFAENLCFISCLFQSGTKQNICLINMVSNQVF